MSPASVRQQRALFAAFCCTVLVQHLSAAGPTTVLDYKLTLKWWEATRHGFLEYSVQPSQVLAHTEELRLQWINFLDASSPTWMLDIAGFEAQQREFSIKPSHSGKSMDVVLKLDLDTRATNYARWAPAGRRTFPTHLRVDIRMTGRLTDSGSTEGSKVRHSNGALVCTYKVTEDLYEFHDLVVTENGVAINGTSLVEKFQTGTLSVKKTTIAPASWS